MLSAIAIFPSCCHDTRITGPLGLGAETGVTGLQIFFPWNKETQVFFIRMTMIHGLK